MSRNRFVDFDLGPALVQRLLPQRPPFLMIDRFDAFAPDEPIAVRASRYLSANEPVFQGHFPQLPLLPGALMVEGVGQTASLAFTMSAIRDAYVERGLDLETLVADLKNLDRGFSLKPGYRPDPEAPILEAFSVVGGMPVGVAGGIRMKFLRPVTPGCKLDYEAIMTHRLGEQLHFEVTALVGGEEVLRGTLSAAVVEGLSLPGFGS